MYSDYQNLELTMIVSFFSWFQQYGATLCRVLSLRALLSRLPLAHDFAENDMVALHATMDCHLLLVHQSLWRSRVSWRRLYVLARAEGVALALDSSKDRISV